MVAYANDCHSNKTNNYGKAGRSQHEKTKKHKVFLNIPIINLPIVKKECQCGGLYDDKHKSQHSKSKQHQNFINNVVKPIKGTIECECGGKYDSAHKNRHMKTQKHNKWVENAEAQ